MGDLTDEQRQLYYAITASERTAVRREFALTDEYGRLEGPFNAMLFSPLVGDALQSLGTAIRFKGTLTERQREIAILEVARLEGSEYEWRAHRGPALAAGLAADQLALLSEGEPVPGLESAEQMVLAAVRDLVAHGDISEDLFEAAVAELGLVATTELVVLVGYYRLLALILRVWRVPPPE